MIRKLSKISLCDESTIPIFTAQNKEIRRVGSDKIGVNSVIDAANRNPTLREMDRSC
jgi:hypothetical protein